MSNQTTIVVNTAADDLKVLPLQKNLTNHTAAAKPRVVKRNTSKQKNQPAASKEETKTLFEICPQKLETFENEFRVSKDGSFSGYEDSFQGSPRAKSKFSVSQ